MYSSSPGTAGVPPAPAPAPVASAVISVPVLLVVVVVEAVLPEELAAAETVGGAVTSKLKLYVEVAPMESFNPISIMFEPTYEANLGANLYLVPAIVTNPGKTPLYMGLFVVNVMACPSASEYAGS